MIVTASSAQTIDLSDSLSPPPIAQPSHASRLIKQLEREALGLTALEHQADPSEVVLYRARINLRKLAADLLSAGDRAGADGGSTILAGMILAFQRTAIDAAFKGLASASSEHDESIRKLLIAFNSAAVAKLEQGMPVDPNEFDLALRITVLPLSDAIAALKAKPVVSHWIARRLVTGGPFEPEVDRFDARELEGRIQSARLPPKAQEQLESILEFLRRGEQFPELQSRIDSYGALIDQLLDSWHMISMESCLEEAERQRYGERLTSALALFREPRTREAGQRGIERLHTSAQLVQLLGELDQAQVDVKPIAQVLFSAESQIDQDATASDGRRQLAVLAPVFVCMAEFRRPLEKNLKRDLHLIERDLQKAYRAAEETLIKQLAATLANPRWSADPALSSLVMDHRQRLVEILRLRRVPDWVKEIGAIDPRSAESFERQVMKLNRWLLEPTRRPEAAATLELLEKRLLMFRSLPFEKELKSGKSGVIKATGGLHQELSAIIISQRRMWAMAYGEGDWEGQPTRRMASLHRLMRTMADAAILADDANVRIAALNRWAAWQCDPDLLRRPIADVLSRLKLASAAAVADDETGLTQELDRLNEDAPLVRLVGRLVTLLQEQLNALPQAGSVEAMGKIILAPGPNDFMASHRRELASLCRYAMEMEFARAGGGQEAAAAINVFVCAAAERLLQELE